MAGGGAARSTLANCNFRPWMRASYWASEPASAPSNACQTCLAVFVTLELAPVRLPVSSVAVIPDVLSIARLDDKPYTLIERTRRVAKNGACASDGGVAERHTYHVPHMMIGCERWAWVCVALRDACRTRCFGEIKFGTMGGTTPWGRGTLE